MTQRDLPHTPSPTWIDQARALLDDSTHDLDAATLSRLNRARQAALGQQRPRTAGVWLLPAGLASACVLLVAVAAWLPHRHADSGHAAAPIATAGKASDNDDLTDDASLEFYQDLDFYAWLGAQGKDGDG